MDAFATPPSSDEDGSPGPSPPPADLADVADPLETFAKTIQRLYRRTKVPKEFKKLARLRRRAVRLQSHLRMLLCLRRFRFALLAVLRTQRSYRRFRVRKWPTSDVIKRTLDRTKFLKGRREEAGYEFEDYDDFMKLLHPSFATTTAQDDDSFSTATSTAPFATPLYPSSLMLPLSPSSLSTTTSLRASYPLGYTACLTHLTRSLHTAVVPDRIKAMSSGRSHTLYLTLNGRVFSAGKGPSLGYFSKAPVPSPILIEHLYSRVVVPPSTTVSVTKISTGEEHSMCLTSDGRLFSFGDNKHGQLGYQTAPNRTLKTNDSFVPRMVKFNAPVVNDVACGATFTIALVKGTLYCWGEGKYLAQGNFAKVTDADTPRVVKVKGSTFAKFQKITAGLEHAVAISSDNDVFCWGSNMVSQCGLPSTETTRVLVATPIKKFKAHDISAGGYHTLALTKQGGIYAWGSNKEGQCGDVNLFNIHAPRRVMDIPNNFRATSVAAGHRSSTAMVNGRVYQWGVVVTENYATRNDHDNTKSLTVKEKDMGSHWYTDTIATEPTISGRATPYDAELELGVLPDESTWGERTGVATTWSSTITASYVSYYIDAKAEEVKKRSEYLRRTSMKQMHMSPVRKKQVYGTHIVKASTPLAINPEWNKFSTRGRFDTSNVVRSADVNDEITRRFRSDLNGILTPNPKALAKTRRQEEKKKREEERRENAKLFRGMQSLLGGISSDEEDSGDERARRSKAGRGGAVAAPIEDEGMVEASEALSLIESSGGNSSNVENNEPPPRRRVEPENAAVMKLRTSGSGRKKKRPPPPPMEEPPPEDESAGRGAGQAATRPPEPKKAPPSGANEVAPPPPPPPLRPPLEQEQNQVQEQVQKQKQEKAWPVSKDLENVGMPQRKSVIIPPSSVRELSKSKSMTMKKRLSYANSTSSSFGDFREGKGEQAEGEDDSFEGNRARNRSMLQRHSSSVGLDDDDALGGGGRRGDKGKRGISIASLLSMDMDGD
jgi:alpha-tubulin suppressor-like RCC1 family protein